MAIIDGSRSSYLWWTHFTDKIRNFEREDPPKCPLFHVWPFSFCCDGATLVPPVDGETKLETKLRLLTLAGTPRWNQWEMEDKIKNWPDQVIPLYGRGGRQRDPRDDAPPRPPGQRTEPQDTGGAFSNFGFDGGFQVCTGWFLFSLQNDPPACLPFFVEFVPRTLQAHPEKCAVPSIALVT